MESIVAQEQSEAADRRPGLPLSQLEKLVESLACFFAALFPRSLVVRLASDVTAAQSGPE